MFRLPSLDILLSRATSVAKATKAVRKARRNLVRGCLAHLIDLASSLSAETQAAAVALGMCLRRTSSLRLAGDDARLAGVTCTARSALAGQAGQIGRAHV